VTFMARGSPPRRRASTAATVTRGYSHPHFLGAQSRYPPNSFAHGFHELPRINPPSPWDRFCAARLHPWQSV
jgi:hypothetical protein